jgi:uncharacterized GH25 family protein
MKNLPRLAFSAVLGLCALLAGTTAPQAHDVWLTLTGGASDRRVVINYGHPGDRPPALADKIVALAAVSAQGRTSLLSDLSHGTARGAPVALSRPFADDGKLLLLGEYDNGYWAKGAEGLYRNASRKSVAGASEAIWSRKFAKAVTGAGAPWQTPAGHTLEILPLSDPGAAARGDQLRVRILFRGAPLAGARIEHDAGGTSASFKSDAAGEASLPIERAGPHLISVDHRVTPSETPELADADLFGATLSFSVPRASLSDWLAILNP